MKKIIAFSLILASLIVLSGCNNFLPEVTQKTPGAGVRTDDKSTKSTELNRNIFAGSRDEEYYMIAFLSGLDYWKGCFKGFEHAGKQFGVRTVYLGDTGYDINTSVGIFEQVVARNPSGIAVACIDSAAFYEPIKKAIKSGVNVVTYDSDSADSGRVCFVATGNRAAGAGAARHMAKLIGGEGSVSVLYSVGLPCAQERVDGFKECLEREFPKIKVVASADDKGDQLEAIKSYRIVIQENQSIKGVFCADGIAGVSAATVIKEADKIGKVHIIGFDCDKVLLDLIKGGTVDASIAQGTYTMGYWSMNVLFNLKHELNPEKYPAFIDTGFEIVTRENVEPYYSRYSKN